MAIRVSRQDAEVLYLPDPESRVSRQIAEVLSKESGEIRVSRQHVEVLVPDSQIYEKSATSTLTLTQQALRQAMIIEQSASSPVSLGSATAFFLVQNQLVTSALTLLQETNVSPKFLYAASFLSLIHETAFPGTHIASASSTLSLTDSIVQSGLLEGSATSTLTLVQYADDETKARDLSSVLTITDTASVDKILQGFSTLSLTQSAETTKELFVESQLTLTQSSRQLVKKLYATTTIELSQTHRLNPQFLSASNTLELSQQNTVTKPIRVSAVSELTTIEFVWDLDTLVPVETGLRQEAATEAIVTYIASSVIPITHDTSVSVALATGTSLSASSQINFNHKAIPKAIEESATSTLVFSQIAYGAEAKPGSSPIELEQVASVTIIRGLNATSEIDLEQSNAYTLIIGTTKCQYSPFVGSTTDPNAPAPPPATIDGPMAGIQVPFQLVYPSSGVVTDSVSLKTPNFGNKDRLSFQRVLRETRGGTLIVYADPIWPKTQTLALTFSGLFRVEAQELLTFIQTYLGQEIGLIDWEQRFWRGVIKTPDEPAIEDRFDSFTVNMEFEGELDPTWNPQVVPEGLRYSDIRSPQDDGYYTPIPPQLPQTPEAVDFYSAEADSTIVIGNPVYLTGVGHANPARADAPGTTQVVGLSLTDTSTGFICDYISEGRIERSDWTGIAGVATLSAGVTYFLSPSVAGQITSTAPTAAGQYVVRVGRAVSQTILDIEIELPILL